VNINLLDNIFCKKEYKPQLLIEKLEVRFPKLKEFYKSGAGVLEGYSLKQHTLLVLSQFEKYYSNKSLPGGVDSGFFRVVLALHDIGKPDAIQSGGKHLQHEHTLRILVPILEKLGCCENEIRIATSLLSSDLIGSFIRNRSKDTPRKISEMAVKAKLPDSDFLDLLILFYKVDAGSYTEDAGGLKSLDKLFVFDRVNKSIDFSSSIARRVAALETFIKKR
jgi:hypothetical protein